MCDPLTAVALIGSAVSAGGAMYEANQQSQAQAAMLKNQTDANNAWVAYQTHIHQQQAAQEDAARERATGDQQATLQKVNAPAQQATQSAEQDRLNTLYGKTAGTSTGASDPSNLLLSGESTGNKTFMNDLTSQVNTATAQARGRIQALATANSYGGSFGGLATTVPIAFAQGGNDINMQNAIRQGNLKTYGVQQQVQPLQYAFGPGYEAAGSMAKGLGQLAGSLAGYAGPKLAGSLSSAFNASGAAAGAGSGFDGSITNPNVSGIFNSLPDDTFV